MHALDRVAHDLHSPQGLCQAALLLALPLQPLLPQLRHLRQGPPGLHQRQAQRAAALACLQRHPTPHPPLPSCQQVVDANGRRGAPSHLHGHQRPTHTAALAQPQRTPPQHQAATAAAAAAAVLLSGSNGHPGGAGAGLCADGAEQGGAALAGQQQASAVGRWQEQQLQHCCSCSWEGGLRRAQLQLARGPLCQQGNGCAALGAGQGQGQGVGGSGRVLLLLLASAGGAGRHVKAEDGAVSLGRQEALQDGLAEGALQGCWGRAVLCLCLPLKHQRGQAALVHQVHQPQAAPAGHQQGPLLHRVPPEQRGAGRSQGRQLDVQQGRAHQAAVKGLQREQRDAHAARAVSAGQHLALSCAAASPTRGPGAAAGAHGQVSHQAAWRGVANQHLLGVVRLQGHAHIAAASGDASNGPRLQQPRGHAQGASRGGRVRGCQAPPHHVSHLGLLGCGGCIEAHRATL